MFNLVHLLFVSLTPYASSPIGHDEGDRIATHQELGIIRLTSFQFLMRGTVRIGFMNFLGVLLTRGTGRLPSHEGHKGERDETGLSKKWPLTLKSEHEWPSRGVHAGEQPA